MMPIRDVVIFPFMMTPFVVGRESSVRAPVGGNGLNMSSFREI